MKKKNRVALVGKLQFDYRTFGKNWVELTANGNGLLLVRKLHATFKLLFHSLIPFHFPGDIETTLVREGEKLSDLLSMPVKDSFGRDLGVNYENDIVNIKEILGEYRPSKRKTRGRFPKED